MIPSGMNRRDFLVRASLVALSGSSLIEQARGQDSKFVIAETACGKIRGIENRGIKIFKGVPYGASTAGANRFMPPVDPPRWAGVRDALEWGPRAPQTVPRPPAGARSTPASTPRASATPRPAPGPSLQRALQGVPDPGPTGEGEDCLMLNIWTPALDDGRKRPVMLWLHGGGFRTGYGSYPAWDGTNLCLRGDVVLITINHRLNVCGFANFSEFSPDFAASGQAGMLDIVHALKWVRANITQFGGDPGTVMIFGQSGGGSKCETLLAMPSAKGLFHRAAIESGTAIRVVDRDVAVRNAEQLLARLGLATKDVHKVQQLPLDQILIAAAGVGNSDFSPSVGSPFLPQHPFHPAASPVSPDVPIIIGCTRTEATGSTTDAALWHLDEAGMRSQVKKLLGDEAVGMIDLYRKHNPGATPSDIYFLIASDHSYGAKTMKAAERRAALGQGPVYLYYFAWETPVQGGLLKSPHYLECPFVFDNAKLSANLTGGGPEALALADKVSDTWIAFARTGNPDNPKMPHWPAYEAKDRATMIINIECKVVNDPLREQRIAMCRALNLT